MRKLTSILAVGLMVAATATAYAQAEVTSVVNKVTAGGYNQVNISYASESFHSSMKLGNLLDAATSGKGGDIDKEFNPTISLQGFGLEYIRGFKVSKKLPMFVEAGLNVNFTFGDMQTDSKGPKYKSQHIGINIPISFAYKFNIKNKFDIKPYAGIDFRISALGRTKLTAVGEDDESDNFSRSYDDDDFDYDDGEEDSEWGNWFSEEYNEPAWKRFNLGWHIGVDFEYRKFNVGIAFTSDITRIASNEFFKMATNQFALKVGYTF